MSGRLGLRRKRKKGEKLAKIMTHMVISKTYLENVDHKNYLLAVIGTTP